MRAGHHDRTIIYIAYISTQRLLWLRFKIKRGGMGRAALSPVFYEMGSFYIYCTNRAVYATLFLYAEL